MKRANCDFCGEALGESRLVVHDPNGISGSFCLTAHRHGVGCYLNAKDHAKMAARMRAFADLETLAPVEGKRL